MQELGDIFAIWDSVRDMSTAVNRPYDTVLAWRIRGRIPEDAWQDVIDAAVLRGKRLTIAEIMAVNEPLKQRGRRRRSEARVN